MELILLHSCQDQLKKADTGIDIQKLKREFSGGRIAGEEMSSGWNCNEDTWSIDNESANAKVVSY